MPWMRAGAALLLLAAGVAAGCQGSFPKCNKSCTPCLECDQLIGNYEGMLTNFNNDCLDGMDPQMQDQPWGLSFDEIHYDEAEQRSYLEFDLTDQDYGIVTGTLCAPKEKDGEQVYAFCMNFSYDSMLSTQQSMQTTLGAFIEGADGSVRFEGTVHNLTHDPINGACHIKAKATAVRLDPE